MIERFTNWVFRHRLMLVCAFGVLTLFMAWQAAHLRVDASFNKSLPSDHPYIRTFTKYQSEFGGANRVLIALMTKEGDIFTPEFFAQLKTATDEATFLTGVDRAQVQSLYTPNVRYIEVVEDGFSGGNVMPADFRPTPASFARVRENIIKSGKLGQLVANDFTGAIVSAQLHEVDPQTGRKLDYMRIAGELEAIRERIERDTGGRVSVHASSASPRLSATSATAPGMSSPSLPSPLSSPRCSSGITPAAGNWPRPPSSARSSPWSGSWGP
jgi:predicted RND superfamily exporter protein